MTHAHPFMMFTDPKRCEKPKKTQELVNYYTLWVEFALGEVWGGVRYLGQRGNDIKFALFWVEKQFLGHFTLMIFSQ